MKRILKILRSRYFLAALAIALEFTQLLVVFILLYEYFFPITVMGWIFHTGVLLYLINRDEIPEFKLPWLMILFLLPVIGAFVFMLLSSNETSRKTTERYEKVLLELKPYRKQTAAIQTLRTQDAEAYAQAFYLYNAAVMPCYANSKTAYCPLGEAFLSALLDDLHQAERFVFMEYFIVQEGKMWDAIHAVLKEKAAQGVSVFIMYDDFGCMTTLPEHYYQQLCEEGIHCIPSNRFTPILSNIHNNRDHRKITVIDGNVGYTGGINLADEYINAYEKHGHWRDTAVRFEGETVRNLTALFLTSWNTQSKETVDCDLYMETPVKGFAGQGYVIPFGDGPAPLYPDTIMQMITSFSGTVVRSVSGFTAGMPGMILRIPYAVWIGLLVAVVDIMPVLGTGLVLLPWAVIVAFMGNFPLTAGMVLLYILMTAVRNIVEPRLVGRQIGLHPLAALISIFVGMQLFGIIGLFVLPVALSLAVQFLQDDVLPLPAWMHRQSGSAAE